MKRRNKNRRPVRKQQSENEKSAEGINKQWEPSLCLLCNSMLADDYRHALTTEEVITRKAFWRMTLDYFQKNDLELPCNPDGMVPLVNEVAARNTLWMVCDNCAVNMGLDSEETLPEVSMDEKLKDYRLIDIKKNGKIEYIRREAYNSAVHAAKSAWSDLVCERLDAAAKFFNDNKRNDSDDARLTENFQSAVQGGLLSQDPNHNKVYRTNPKSTHFSSNVPPMYKSAYINLIIAGLTEAELPPTPNHLADLAKKNRVKNGTWSDYFDKSKKAEQPGGKCEICGWKDGDGIKPCFYSDAIGAVIHSNSREAFEASMSRDQLDLFDTYCEKKPTHSCGGSVELPGPYYIKCSKCNCQIKLWEHGINFYLG